MTDPGKEAAERVWLVLDALLAMHPGMPLSEGVPLAQKTYAQIDWLRAQGISEPPQETSLPPGSWAPKVLAGWAGRQEKVTDALDEGKKINAIKELRGLTGAGLRESKEAVEWLCEHDPRAVTRGWARSR